MTGTPDDHLDATPGWADEYQDRRDEDCVCWACDGEGGTFILDEEYTCGEQVWVRCAVCGGEDERRGT